MVFNAIFFSSLAPALASPPNPVISECLQLSLKVLVNLTNHNQTACVCVAENDGIETGMNSFFFMNFFNWRVVSLMRYEVSGGNQQKKKKI